MLGGCPLNPGSQAGWQPGSQGVKPRGLVGIFFFSFPPSWVICRKRSLGGRSELSKCLLLRGTGSCWALPELGAVSPRGAGSLLHRGVVPPATAVPMAEDIDWLDLPGRWTYGVCGDGRIFFIKYGPAWPQRGLPRGRGLRWGSGGAGCVAWGGLQGLGGLVRAGNKGYPLLQASVSGCFPITHGHLSFPPTSLSLGLTAVPACWMLFPSGPKIPSFHSFGWKSHPCCKDTLPQ